MLIENSTDFILADSETEFETSHQYIDDGFTAISAFLEVDFVSWDDHGSGLNYVTPANQSGEASDA